MSHSSGGPHIDATDRALLDLAAQPRPFKAAPEPNPRNEDWAKGKYAGELSWMREAFHQQRQQELRDAGPSEGKQLAIQKIVDEELTRRRNARTPPHYTPDEEAYSGALHHHHRQQRHVAMEDEATRAFHPGESPHDHRRWIHDERPQRDHYLARKGIRPDLPDQGAHLHPFPAVRAGSARPLANEGPHALRTSQHWPAKQRWTNGDGGQLLARRPLGSPHGFKLRLDAGAEPNHVPADHHRQRLLGKQWSTQQFELDSDARRRPAGAGAALRRAHSLAYPGEVREDNQLSREMRERHGLPPVGNTVAGPVWNWSDTRETLAKPDQPGSNPHWFQH